jgi:hypothetical protein
MRNPRVVVLIFGVSGNAEDSVLCVKKLGAYGNAKEAASTNG